MVRLDLPSTPAGVEDPAAASEQSRRLITRDALADGSFMAAVRSLPGVEVESDAALEASLSALLAGRPEPGPVWLFGYGSLMWNPAFDFAERRTARLRGWQRRFCLSLPFGRGSREQPGLALALDRGGSTRGVVFRLPDGAERAELLLVWRREMFSGAYRARWLTVTTEAGPVKAVTFVVDRSRAAYVGGLDEAATAAQLCAARGPLGTGADYLRETLAHLDGLGIRDRGLNRLRELVAAG